MRHNKKKGLKLGTDASHTKAMKKSLAKALFENDRIKTTETRAKALRSYAEPIITWAKKGDLHSLVSPSPSSVIRISLLRFSTRPLRVCGPTAMVVTPAS